MSNTFAVGDDVKMAGVPFIVRVLELGTCTDPSCEAPTFRFADPESGEDDWMHEKEFSKVAR